MKTICPRCWNVRRPCDFCKNTGQIEDTKLSENFWLSEFTYSRKAEKLGIPNDMNSKQVARARNFVRIILQPLRDDVGPLFVTSGFRSKNLNNVLPGASKTSAHMAAWAADIKPGKVSLEEIMRWFRDGDRCFDQAILEPSWVHIGYKHPSGKQRHEILEKVGKNYPHWEDED